MKRLILLRHAKAAPAGDGPDHDRDLSALGVQDAVWAGSSIAAGGWAPDVALVSDARRTQRTAAEALPALRPQPTLLVEPRLYEASVNMVLRCIANARSDAACLLVIGHNPGVAMTAARLARGGTSEACARLTEGFPTTAIAVFTLSIASWREIGNAAATLVAFLTPHRGADPGCSSRRTHPT